MGGTASKLGGYTFGRGVKTTGAGDLSITGPDALVRSEDQSILNLAGLNYFRMTPRPRE